MTITVVSPSRTTPGQAIVANIFSSANTYSFYLRHFQGTALACRRHRSPSPRPLHLAHVVPATTVIPIATRLKNLNLQVRELAARVSSPELRHCSAIVDRALAPALICLTVSHEGRRASGSFHSELVRLSPLTNPTRPKATWLNPTASSRVRLSQLLIGLGRFLMF